MPAYRATGVVGYHLALGLIVVNALVAGRPLAVALGVALVCGLSFFAWALLRLWVTGTENIVQLEHVWVACAATGGYLVAIGQPVWPWFDLLAVALAVFLACGRVGCLLAGCCHGFPCGVGIVYTRPTHPLRGVRLFPLPVLEVLGLLVLAVIGQCLFTARPGTACLVIAAGYAVLRFGTEGLRGDRVLRRGPVSSGRLMAVAQLVAVVVVDEFVRQPEPHAARLVSLGAGLAGVAVAGWRWRRPRPLSRAVIQELRAAAAAGTVDELRLADGVTVSVRTHPFGTEVAIGVSGEAAAVTADAARRLCVAAFAREPDVTGGDGAAHVLLEPQDSAARTAARDA